MPETKNIYLKLLSVQQKLKPCSQSGRNDYHKYNYSTALDVIEPVKQACNELGLFLSSTIAESEIENGWAKCVVELMVLDIETAETVKVVAPGFAKDTGDKAIYKAITGATKYAFRAMFTLGSTDDPEKDSPGENKPRYISQAQVIRLHTIVGELGIPNQKAKEILQKNGYESSKVINFYDYDRIVKVLQDYAKRSKQTTTVPSLPKIK